MSKREVLDLGDMKQLLLGGSIVIPDRLNANVDVEIAMEDVGFDSLHRILDEAQQTGINRLGVAKRLNAEMIEVERHGD